MGWFADVDPDARRDCQWQPVIADDYDASVLASLPTWFATKGECERFIREQLIPNARTLDDDEPPAARPPEPVGPVIARADVPIGVIVQWLPGKPLTDDYRWCDGGETWSLDEFPEVRTAGVTWIPDLRPTPDAPPACAIRVRR